MAHRNTQRRILADPESKVSSMDPTFKRQPKPTTSHHLTTNPDPKMPSKPSSMSNSFSRLITIHRPRLSQKPTAQQQSLPPLVDTHLQAKAMSVSAMVDDTSKYSFTKGNDLSKTEKHSKAAAKDVRNKDKYRKPMKEVDKKKVEEVVVEEKKEANEDLKNIGQEGEKMLERKKLPVSLGLSGGRRRSLCGSHVNLADVFANNGVKVVAVDMPPFMQIHAVECARKTHDSLEKFTSKTLALTLKKEFDGIYGPAWHCIVGTSFGSFVTHSVGGFLYFSMDQKLYILLFKTTVQIAD
ncbi:hypothetical protein FEM48_Zijuj05G0082300 [Ziziphus jujuba var. spinosa]|uniref:Dynein light chain, cytoplasmic n=1 Tax=Ziziphus jujuba var. spinosa TaxID=714518 RepID=A0A978VDU5_ZIZJJ|nr:hypothetical protein FEM48_Zijuj05G0082300 [Ziziphus jujuba var. spinosa]